MPMIKVKTSDNKIAEIEEPIARMSLVLQETLDDRDANDNEPIPLKDCTSDILAIVLKWCRHHVNDPKDIYESDEESQGYGFQLIANRVRWCRRYTVVPKWDQEFLKVDNNTLFGVVTAAHNLQIKKLLNYTTATLADKMRNKTPEQIRTEFNIVNDLDDEDDDEIQLLSVDQSRTGKNYFK